MSAIEASCKTTVGRRPTLSLVFICATLSAGCASVIQWQDKTQTAWKQERSKAELMSKRVYVGGAIGNTTLSPNTAGTLYAVDNKQGTSSQMRVGIDVHPSVSVEIDTALLGSATLAQSDLDVAYTTATLSTLIYGFGNKQNRLLRRGFNPYGRLGYAVMQRTSKVDSLDHSDNNFVVGAGAEYGFNNGFALRAELTRNSGDANQVSLGGIIRLGAVKNSPIRVIAEAQRAPTPHSNGNAAIAQNTGLAMRVHNFTPSDNDTDGDGVINKLDVCSSTKPDTTVNNEGCGFFDAVLSKVQFKPASYWLSPKSRGQLDALAQTLLAFPEARIEVGAHSDNHGDAALNLDLSNRRAQSVASYLQSKGVAKEQLIAVGYGEQFPIADNALDEGRKQNRRIELKTLPNIGAPDLLVENALGETGEYKQDVSAEQLLKLSKKVKPFEAVDLQDNKGTQSALAVIAENVAETDKKSTQAQALQRSQMHVFSAMKIVPLPAPAEVFGLHLTGPLAGVTFVDRSAVLTDSAKIALMPVQSQLEKFPNVRITIMGHLDNQGQEEDNLLLSAQRANAVVEYLVSQGIAPERLMSEGYGSELPLVQELSEADQKRNRRIEIRVLE